MTTSNGLGIYSDMSYYCGKRSHTVDIVPQSARRANNYPKTLTKFSLDKSTHHNNMPAERGKEWTIPTRVKQEQKSTQSQIKPWI